MRTIGPAACFDGRTARRRPVSLAVDGADLLAVEGSETVLRWPLDAVRREEAPHDRLTIGGVGDDLARIEIEDEAVAAEVARLCPRLSDKREGDRTPVWRILGWSLAATASIVATVVYLIPVAAEQGAALVPYRLERRLGDAFDARVRILLGGDSRTCSAPEGVAALAKLSGALAARAGLPEPPRIAVLPSETKNAVALPGGRIYLLDGLLKEAKTPDEVAGVLAHEVGHVAHRDGLARMLQVGGTSYLLGLLFGDIGGAGVIVAVAETFLETSHSRATELRADAYAARLMADLGRPATPLGDLLVRLGDDDEEGGLDFLRTHPGGGARREALARGPNPDAGPPLLTPAEWTALRGICSATSTGG